MTTKLNEADLLEIYAFTKKLAKAAGSIILEGSKAIREARAAEGATEVKEKSNPVDLVTEWDVKVENHVKGLISERYPSFAFIGEESYSNGIRTPATDEPTFCVDPIDGTTNFVHGFPFACVSIGLLYNKNPVIGVIYNPFLDQLFSGLSGHGAFLNETTRLPTALPGPLISLAEAVVGVEWGSDRSKVAIEKKTLSFAKLAGNGKEIPGGRLAHALRSMGSAALNYTLVASGGLDIYWEIGCWPWDVCAGIVIAQESGALVSGGKDSPIDGNITEDLLWGRKYIVVRAIADTKNETGVQAQQRIIREFYETVEDWHPQ